MLSFISPMCQCTPVLLDQLFKCLVDFRACRTTWALQRRSGKRKANSDHVLNPYRPKLTTRPCEVYLEAFISATTWAFQAVRTSLYFTKKAIHAMQWKCFDWKDTPWRSCTDFLRLIGEPRSRSHKTRRCDVTSSNQFNNASLKFLLDVTALITRKTYTQEALVMCDVVVRVFLWWF